MRILGELCLQTALVAAGYSAFVSFAARNDVAARLSRRGAGAALVCLAALLGTVGVLCHALLTKDLGFEYVAHYTSGQLPWQYRLSALWVGQAGSLLLWASLTAVLAVVFLATSPDGVLKRTALGILMADVAFLVAVMVFAADPMKASLTVRRDGLGLSPLLQHPSMLIHPPVVFLAYAAWTVPFALAAAALVTGRLDATWVRLARPWALLGWVVLGAGLLLGAHWAYQELGWGGYWGWDPVENGSLIPWLTGTALVHSLMTWKHCGNLKKLAVSLAILTFALCNFATFLTRSGLFSSVHAFSQSPIGWMFLGLMAVLLVGGCGLVYRRRHELRPDQPLGGPLARESLVMASAYLLLLLTAVVTVGTLFVPLSSILAGRTIQIGPEFYNFVFAPVGLAALAAASGVPLLRWGSAPTPGQRRALLVCAGVSGLIVVCALGYGLRHPLALIVVGLTALTLGTTLTHWLLDASRLATARGPARFALALRLRRREYAGYVIHLALVCVAIGVTGSSLGSQRLEGDFSEGDVFEWAGRRFEYVRLVQREESDKLVAEVELRVSRGEAPPTTLRPARHLHALQNEWTTEVAIDSTWSADLYTILNAGLGEGRVHLTLVHNPLVRWLWTGGWLAAGGSCVAMWPVRRRRSMSVVPVLDRRSPPPEPRHRRRAA